LIFRSIIRRKFPAFYISDAAAKRRKEIKINAYHLFLCVNFPNLSTDVTFTGSDFGREKKFGILSSATERKLKNGFHHAKEHYVLDFSTYNSAEISGFLPFRYRHEKAKREKKNFNSRRFLAEYIDRCQFFGH